MSDRLKLPPERDFGFYQRRKHDKWRAVAPPAPPLEGPVADSHAHIHMLPDPAWELARCAANGVDFVCMIVDPSEDGAGPFERLGDWVADAESLYPAMPLEAAFAGVSRGSVAGAVLHGAETGESAGAATALSLCVGENGRGSKSPLVRIAAGVHPHNAKLYTAEVEASLVARLDDPRVGALGEIGLDYHYDLSPRDVQRDVFCRQIAVAQQVGLPIVLHLRGGEDPERDNAHREAFRILEEAGALGPRTLLHCCALAPDELQPWVDADCYIAYGGALTFKNADAAREGARLVPIERLMLETDSPYMTPEPMRGAACTPAHVVFTAAALSEVRGIAPGSARRAFLEQVHANTVAFYERNE